MNEHFLKLDYKEIPFVKSELKGVRFKNKALLEPINPVEYNLVIYSTTKNEYYCAEGIINSLVGYRKCLETAE